MPHGAVQRSSKAPRSTPIVNPTVTRLIAVLLNTDDRPLSGEAPSASSAHAAAGWPRRAKRPRPRAQRDHAPAAGEGLHRSALGHWNSGTDHVRSPWTW